MTAKTDLLPCPFCGLDVTDNEGCFPLNREGTRWEVRCGNPSCFAYDPCDESMQAAIARWNRRAIAARDAEIEALRTELDRLRGEHVRVRRDRNAAQARAERMKKALRLIESAKDRGFGIDYARGVAQSILLHDQEGRTDG